MSSRTANSTYSSLMDNMWMPTDDTRARIERLEQLRALREQGRPAAQNTNSESGQRLSARERFFQSYELPNWGRGGTEHQIATGAGSLSITREPRRSTHTQPRRNTLPEVPGFTDLRHSAFGHQSSFAGSLYGEQESTFGNEPFYEEPPLSEEELAATYTPLAMFSEDPSTLDEADGSIIHRPNTNSRAAFIDNKGKAHWIEPYNPVLKGHITLKNRDEYIATITRSLQPKAAEQLESLLIQWYADEVKKKAEMGGRLSPEGQFDDGSRGKNDKYALLTNLLLQKSKSVDDVEETYFSGVRPRKEQTLASGNGTDLVNMNINVPSDNSDSVDGSSQDCLSGKQSAIPSNSEHEIQDSVGNSQDQVTGNTEIPRYSTDRTRNILLRRDTADRRIRRTGNIRRHISDVSGMHPTRIAGLYRGRSVLPDNDWRDSISQQHDERDASAQDSINSRGSEGNSGQVIEDTSLYGTAEPLIETDENESNSQPGSPRRFISRTEIITSPTRRNQSVEFNSTE